MNLIKNQLINWISKNSVTKKFPAFEKDPYSDREIARGECEKFTDLTNKNFTIEKIVTYKITRHP